MTRRLRRICINKIIRYISSPANQRRSILTGLLVLCITFITTNYIADHEKNSYFVLLKSKIDDLSYRLNLISVRICCLVSTSPENLLTRARAVNATWGSRCDRLFFLTEYSLKNMTLEQKEFLQQIPIAPIHNMKSGYDHLTQKSILAFLFVYKNYFNDFDWFVKTDDDTYLIIENLKEFLRKQDTSQPITFGYNFRVHVAVGYHSGGAAYVLSREALKRFYQAHQITNNTMCEEDEGLEDIEIARCLREQGVQMGKSLDEHNRELFHPLTFVEHFSGKFPAWLKFYAENPLQSHYNCCSERSISFHYIKPEEQYYLEFLLYKLRFQ